MKTKLGIQTIVFGSKVGEDIEWVLKSIKEAGYDGVETPNLFLSHNSNLIIDLFKKYNLEHCGVHVGYGEIAKEETFAKHLDFLKKMNGKYFICSGVSNNETLSGYETSAETFNKIGRICKDNGVYFCYHNHAWEFTLINGQKGIHRLCELTDSDLVKLCVDVYWVTVGGEEPADFIEKYKDRAIYYHFKDGGKGYFTEMGKGTIDLKSAFEKASKLSYEWIIAEQDKTDIDVIESININRKYMKELGI